MILVSCASPARRIFLTDLMQSRLATSRVGPSTSVRIYSLIDLNVLAYCVSEIMTPAEAEKFKYNVFDLTKEWRPEDVPYQEVGRIVLNQNP
jgi:hypothetical protein